jgi:hypothetical protein
VFGGGRSPFETELFQDDLSKLRSLAAQRLREEWLQRWWCNKFNRPRKDPLLAEYTYDELLMEWLEDEIEKDPMAAYSKDALEKGLIFANTGDELVDKWERDIAAGKKPDIVAEAGLDAAMVERWLKGKSKPMKAHTPVVAPAPEAPPPEEEEFTEGFAEKYTE